jgi:hypothetical protein
MAGIKGTLSSIDKYETMVEVLTYRMNEGMKKYNFLDKEKMNEFTFKKEDIEKELPRDTFGNLRKYSEEFNAMKERNDAAKTIQTAWRTKQRGGDLSEELKKLIAKILVEYNKRGMGISEWSSVILHGISDYIMETHDEAREERIAYLEKKFLSMDPGEESVTRYSQPPPWYTVQSGNNVEVVYAPTLVLENIGAFMAEEFPPWREGPEDAVRFDSDDEGVHRHFTNDDMEVSRSELLKAMSVLVKEGKWICDTYFAIIICHFVINMLGVVAGGTDPKLQEALNRDFNLGYTFWYDLALMGVINLPGLLGFFIYVFMGDQVDVEGRVLCKSLGVLWKHISEMNRNRPAEKDDEKVVAAVARSKRESRKAVRTAARRSKTQPPAKKDTKKAGPKGGRKRRKTRKRRKKNSKKRTKKKARRRKSKRRRRLRH